MKRRKECPDCRGKMVEGFIPDATYGQILQTHWYPGEAEKSSFLGLPTGLKVDRNQMMPVRTYRCTGCGLLWSYANPEP